MADVFSDLETALPFIQTLEDCGLPAIHYYRIFGKCSTHGTIQATWDEQPHDNDMLVCGQCSGQVKRCPIFAFTEVARPEAL